MSLEYLFETDSKILLVMPFVQGGSLRSLLETSERLTEDDAKFYCRQVIQAILNLHERGIVYRNLKADNILISTDREDNGSIRLTNFSQSETPQEE
jgi:RAC serine/threonine-protein kinase